jgi:hypothetical protein
MNDCHQLSKFSWLLSPFALPPSTQCPEDELEEACLFVQQQCWRFLPAVMPKFLSWIGEQAENLPKVKDLQMEATALKEYAKIQNRLSTQVASVFNNSKIPYAFLKSSALRWIVYDDPSERVGVDLDIAVPADYLEQCKLVIKNIGFEPAQWSQVREKYEKANPILRKGFESRSYELGFFVYRLELEKISLEVEAAIRSQLDKHPLMWFATNDGKLNCNIALDIHHGIALERDIAVEPIVNSHHTIKINEIKYNVPRLSWLLLHLICKIYFEGIDSSTKVMYQYADVCRLISKVYGEEYQHFHSLLIKYKLVTEACFVLRRFQSNFRVQLSDEFICLLENKR